MDVNLLQVKLTREKSRCVGLNGPVYILSFCLDYIALISTCTTFRAIGVLVQTCFTIGQQLALGTSFDHRCTNPMPLR
jgi:hypothetical protein